MKQFVEEVRKVMLEANWPTDAFDNGVCPPSGGKPVKSIIPPFHYEKKRGPKQGFPWFSALRKQYRGYCIVCYHNDKKFTSFWLSKEQAKTITTKGDLLRYADSIGIGLLGRGTMQAVRVVLRKAIYITAKVAKEILVVIQINGQTIAWDYFPTDVTDDDLKASALKHLEQVNRRMPEGLSPQSIKKIVIVPKKLVNIITL